MAEENKEEPKVAPSPIFGQGSTFAGTGFSGFSASEGFASAAKSESAASGSPSAGGATGTAGATDAEEECQAEFKPVVQLEKKEVDTGEESEEIKLEYKAKLYRYDFEKQEWKERGVGMCKILEHKETKKTRVLMRRDKLMKVCANFLIMPGTTLQNHQGNDKTWVWSTPDFADEEMKNELFCIRFGTVEKANEFKEIFDAAVEKNTELIEAEGGLPTKEESTGDEEDKKENADDLAEGLESVKVSADAEEKKEDDAPKDE